VTDIRRAQKALVARILEGDGAASRAQRRAAFDDRAPAGPAGTLIRKVARHAHEVTDDDVAALRAAGLSEDQVFEVVVCAAIGEATRQYQATLAALEAATGKE
jgi:alkylhydroperoxidase family enzyme